MGVAKLAFDEVATKCSSKLVVQSIESSRQRKAVCLVCGVCAAAAAAADKRPIKAARW